MKKVLYHLSVLSCEVTLYFKCLLFLDFFSLWATCCFYVVHIWFAALWYNVTHLVSMWQPSHQIGKMETKFENVVFAKSKKSKNVPFKLKLHMRFEQ